MLLPLLTTVALLVGTPLVLAARRSVRGTTLHGTWWWAVAALAGGWLVVSCEWVGCDAVTLDRVWYAATVVGLCPGVHVLGARRPVSRSWNGFVVAPMLAVLGLPLATSLWGASTSFQIELPPLIGYLLVLVMSAGNYFGTRFTWPAVLAASGLALIVVAGSSIRPEWLPSTPGGRAIGVGLLAWSAIAAARRATEPVGDDDLLRAWIEFRDLFGIVWAKRVMDRVNQALVESNCQARLDLDGMCWSTDDDSAGDRARATRVVRETFSWLLRRFVDDDWAGRFGIALRTRSGTRVDPAARDESGDGLV